MGFDLTGLWFLGYLAYVFFTPATLDLPIFLTVLFALALIEAVEEYLKYRQIKACYRRYNCGMD